MYCPAFKVLGFLVQGPPPGSRRAGGGTPGGAGPSAQRQLCGTTSSAVSAASSWPLGDNRAQRIGSSSAANESARECSKAATTSLTRTPRTVAKTSNTCWEGSRTQRPDSHRRYVGFEMFACSASTVTLTPAAYRKARRSVAPPSNRTRLRGPVSKTEANRASSSGRGSEVPSSQREIRSPPATPIRLASSCWVRPTRSRAARSASGSTPEATNRNPSGLRLARRWGVLSGRS